MHLPPSLPHSHPRQGTWELETACSVLGRVPWGPVVHPNRPPSMLTPLGTWVPENGDLKLSGPTLPCQGPPPQLGTAAILWGAQSPTSPATPHLGRVLIALSFWLHQGLYQWLLSSFLGHFLRLQAEKGQGL